MKCICDSDVDVHESNFSTINGTVVITCQNCKRMYLESDFSEIEIEKLYWGKCKKVTSANKCTNDLKLPKKQHNCES